MRRVLVLAAVLSALSAARAQMPDAEAGVRAAVEALKKAVAAREASALEQAVAVRSAAVATPDQLREQLLTSGWAPWERFADIFARATLRQVDDVLAPRLERALQTGKTPYAAAVRVLWTAPPEPNAAAPRAEQVWLTYFVAQDGAWRWLCDEYLVQDWRYDQGDPAEARRAVALAIDTEDLVGVHGLIDPELTRGVKPADFVATARRRIDAAKVATPGRKAPAGEKSLRAPRRAPAGVVGRLDAAPHGVKIERRAQRTGDATARVLVRDARGEADPNSAEEFVERSGRWYWRPKASCTAWPTSAAASQPAAAPR